MTKSNFNLSPIYAEGFVGTYVDRESPEREKVVAELVYEFEIAYGSGAAGACPQASGPHR
jgi:hypothetical protein